MFKSIKQLLNAVVAVGPITGTRGYIYTRKQRNARIKEVEKHAINRRKRAEKDARLVRILTK